jgi:hypothetical protein
LSTKIGLPANVALTFNYSFLYIQIREHNYLIYQFHKISLVINGLHFPEVLIVTLR